MSSPKRLYISLLVHEKPDVILDQLRNFRRFAPGAIIVIHLSTELETTDAFVAEMLALGNIYLNPQRVATHKANLLHPHFLNIRFILTLNPADTDFISFHASNDLLVRSGLEDHLCHYDAGYFSDGFLDDKNERFFANRIRRDPSVTALCKAIHCKVLIKSQIEGLYAQVRHLRSVLAIIDYAEFDPSTTRPYFAEEIILPTLLHHVLSHEKATAIGLPYILSEIAIQMKYIELRHRIAGYNQFARAVGWLLKRLGPTRITKGLVDRIRAGDLGYYRFFENGVGVRRFSCEHAFGVKRIERDLNDPLRRHIAQLA